MAELTLAELGVEDDPGTAWHPRGCTMLADLDDDEALEHQAKPEVSQQIDAGRLLGAEDSSESPEGEI
jgi:hypothetical protein